MKRIIIFSAILLSVIACDKLLEEQVFIDVASNNFYQTDDDALKAITGLYAKLRADGSVTDGGGQRESWGFYGMGEGSVFNFNEVTTDEIYVHWESYGGFFNLLEDFTWNPNSGGHFEAIFGDMYQGIRIANNILWNINNDNISQAVQDRVRGEALMIRGMIYSTAFSFYKDIPFILLPVKDPLSPPGQVPADTIIASIVRDLEEAAELLPDTVMADEYGRFTKGAAWATLARFQLNQGNWEAARDASREVYKYGYDLSDSYSDIFAVDNEANPEIIISIPCIAQPGVGNTFIAHTAEPDFVSGGWGGHLIRNDFYATFDPEDQRRSFLRNTYTSLTGTDKTVNLGYMIMKYEVDTDRVGAWAGNDIVLHRLAEVQLTLAEALNEIDGPNQESIDLINELRDRAFNGNTDKYIHLEDFASKEELRAYILAERGWELYAEGYRRDDLIRQGQFIPKAIERGVVADMHHSLFPIPQAEMDLNQQLDQIDGYDE